MRRLLWAGLVVLMVGHAQAQTTGTSTFQLGSDTVQSAELSTAFSTNFVNGDLAVAKSGTSETDSLLRFDVSSLAGKYSEILSVTLTLNVSSVNSTGVLGAYEVSTADSGWGTTTLTVPNWNYQNSASSKPWAGSAGLGTAGVDYNATAVATSEWTNGFSPHVLALEGGSTALTSMLNSWTSGTNGGLLLSPIATATNAFIYFYAGPGGNASLTPELTVTYETTSVPEPDCWLMFGAAMLVIVSYVKCRKRQG